jgi:hypothetical protein
MGSLTRLLVVVVKHFGPGPVIMVVGLVLLHVGLEQRQLAEQLATPAEEIALSDLIAHGPGDRRHVVVKDFTVAGDRYAIHEKSGGLVAWVPVVPTDEQPGDTSPPERFGGTVKTSTRTVVWNPARIQAIIKFDNVQSEEDLKRLVRQKSSVRGLVRATNEGLDAKAKRLLRACARSASKCLFFKGLEVVLAQALRENYPGTDFSKCLLIEAEPSAPLAAVYGVALGLGVSLLAAGALWTLIALRFRLIQRPVKQELAAVRPSTTRDDGWPRPGSTDAIPWAQPVDSEAISWVLPATADGNWRGDPPPVRRRVTG